MKLRNVQALRAVAAFAVVLAHISDAGGIEARWLAGDHHWTSFLHRPGILGVDLFFVISGLIMTVTTRSVQSGPGSSRRFLVRRLTRIYPAYWVALAPLVALFLVRPDMINSSSDVPPRLLESILLLPQPGHPLLLVSWTLTIELYFYLIFALTLLAPRSARLPLLAGWGAVTAVLAVVLNHTDNVWLANFAAPICLEFLFGAVVGELILAGRFYAPAACAVLGFGGAVASVAVAGDLFPDTFYRAVPAGLLIAVGVYGVVGLEGRWRLTAPGWLQTLGDASYSMYLWHVLVLTVLGRFILVRLPGNPVVHALSLAVCVAAVIVSSLVAYRLIERPLVNLLHRPGPRPTPASASAPASAPAPVPTTTSRTVIVMPDTEAAAQVTAQQVTAHR